MLRNEHQSPSCFRKDKVSQESYISCSKCLKQWLRVHPVASKENSNIAWCQGKAVPDVYWEKFGDQRAWKAKGWMYRRWDQAAGQKCKSLKDNIFAVHQAQILRDPEPTVQGIAHWSIVLS